MFCADSCRGQESDGVSGLKQSLSAGLHVLWGLRSDSALLPFQLLEASATWVVARLHGPRGWWPVGSPSWCIADGLASLPLTRTSGPHRPVQTIEDDLPSQNELMSKFHLQTLLPVSQNTAFSSALGIQMWTFGGVVWPTTPPCRGSRRPRYRNPHLLHHLAAEKQRQVSSQLVPKTRDC